MKYADPIIKRFPVGMKGHNVIKLHANKQGKNYYNYYYYYCYFFVISLLCGKTN